MSVRARGTLALALALSVGHAGQSDPVVESMFTLAAVGATDVVFEMRVGRQGDEAVQAAAHAGARLVRVAETELLAADVSTATVALLSVPRDLVDRVGAKLKREMRPGSRIVSREFAIGRWTPTATSRAADGTPLFLWVVPRRPAREPDIFFVPTREAVVDQMLRLAGVTSADIVYDLGSGDGRVVNLAAQKYRARGVGIEIDPPLVEIARQVAREAGIADRVSFVEGDLFTADLSKATVVTLYLSPTVNRKLESKLRTELRPGTRVVSHQFPIGDWEPDQVVAAEDGTNLYLWTVRPPG